MTINADVVLKHGPQSSYIATTYKIILDRIVHAAIIFSSHSRLFHPFEDITIVGEGPQIVSYARPLACLLWHGASVNNGHLRGPVTLTPIAERLEVDLILPVLTT